MTPLQEGDLAVLPFSGSIISYLASSAAGVCAHAAGVAADTNSAVAANRSRLQECGQAEHGIAVYPKYDQMKRPLPAHYLLLLWTGTDATAISERPGLLSVIQAKRYLPSIESLPGCTWHMPR